MEIQENIGCEMVAKHVINVYQPIISDSNDNKTIWENELKISFID